MVQFGEGTADTRRVACLSELIVGGEHVEHVQQVIEPFTAPESRLITVSEQDGQPTYELTHEALINSWRRLRVWLGSVPDKAESEQIRSDLRLHRRLSAAATDWASGRGSLWRPPELTRLQNYLHRTANVSTTTEKLFRGARSRAHLDLTDLEQSFFERSVQAENRAERIRKHQSQFAWAAAAVLLLATVIAVYAAWFANTKTIEAQRQSAVAAAATKEAQEASSQATENKLRALTALSTAATNAGLPVDGIALALAAWPRDATDNRPALNQALVSLSRAVGATVPLRRTFKHEDAVNGALYFKHESRIRWSDDKTLRIWDVATGAQVGPSMEHDDYVKGALLFNNDSRILSWSDDKTLRIWDVATGAQVGPSMEHKGYVKGALLFNNDSRILSWSDDNTLRIWDATTSTQIGPAIDFDARHTDRDEDTILGATLIQVRAAFSHGRDTAPLRFGVSNWAPNRPPLFDGNSRDGVFLIENGRRLLSWSEFGVQERELRDAPHIVSTAEGLVQVLVTSASRVSLSSKTRSASCHGAMMDICECGTLMLVKKSEPAWGRQM